MKRTARTLLIAPLVAGALATTAAPALAYDCFNASRSAQGNTSAAANSGNWWSIPEFLQAVVGLDQSQVDAVMAVVNADPRVPANFTVFFNPNHPGELASPMPDANATNGKGIDHSDDYSTPILDAVMQDAQIALGG